MMSTSAFGVDHGEVSKGIGDKVARGYLQGKAGVQGFKLGRAHHKLARAEQGLSNTFGGSFKQSFNAGRQGPITATTHRLKNQTAKSVARRRTMGDINSMARSAQTKKPGSSLTIPNFRKN